MEEIKVTVVKFGDRANLMLRYIDPITGKPKHKSAGTKNAVAAQREAGAWEAELREGRYAAPSKTTWKGFRERYENEVLPSLAPKTGEKARAVFNAIEKILCPKRLADLNAGRLSHYASKLREDGRTEQTIKGNLAHLRAALSWAVRMGLLAKAPTVQMPKRAKGQKMMKGRPITGEEFDRMLAKLPDVVAVERKLPTKHKPKPLTPAEQAAKDAALKALVASWEHYLRGLWHSGLRLGESLELYWDRDDKLCVDLDAKPHPMLRIPAALEKGNQDRMLPMAPEFVEFLAQTPKGERHGRVFNPQARRMHGDALLPHRVGELIAELGRKAGVKVNTDQGGKVKFATAHDLRRSFGERWAALVMPQQLMELMRHESIETTMRYYVGRNAQSTAAVLWRAHAASGNSFGNTPQNSTETVKQETDAKA